MHSARTSRTPLRLAALIAVAVAGLVCVSVVRSNNMPLEGALKTAIPGMPVEATEKAVPVEGLVTPRAWIHRIFAVPATNPRDRAIAQIEALGLQLDANSCNRAVAAQNRRLIDLFLSSGFDLNARGDRQRTPLLTAALQGNWPLVTELLKAGANPNLPDETGATALMAAALAKQIAPLNDLLQHGAEVKAKDLNGHNALHYAVSAGQVENAKLLLAQGCPVSGPCADGSDLLTHAFDTQRKDLIVPILQAQEADLEWTPEARAFLMGTIGTRKAELTRLILSKFPAAPTMEGKAQPLLSYYILWNDLETCKYLLDCGANANTALNSPVEKEFSGQVASSFTRLYLDNEGGMTVLMLASGMEKTDFVKTLLEHGAKRGLATTKYKMPALFFAAHSETPEIMQMLISDSSPTPDQMRIEISLSSQRLNLYKNGVSVFTSPVSTGRPGFSTPSGQFVVTDKHLTHTSTIYKTAQMPFFMRLNCRDFGMHEGQLPGYPASHGCIRLPGSSARYLYKDVPVGTLVSISR